MIIKKDTIYNDLYIYLMIITTLLIIGFLFIYSASSIYALEMHNDSLYFVKKQLIGLIIGIASLFIMRFIPLDLIKKSVFFFLLISLFLTIATLSSQFGVQIHGSKRWLKIAGFVFQPSELLKMAFILYIAQIFSKKYYAWYRYIPFVLICMATSLVLLKQPDFGLTMTLLGTTILLFFIVQPKLRYVIGLVGSSIIAAIILILAQPYRIQRILTFLDPWQDPQGKGFQIIQSFIAIGSGSWLGAGIAHSKQKFFYLPMQHTDFIFSIIAEETGFVGSTLLIMLFIFFLFFGFRLAQQVKDQMAQWVITAFTILISLQALMNIAVVTGLVPTKGIGLPFISYGNSSLVCTLFMIGIIINMVYQDKYVF